MADRERVISPIECLGRLETSDTMLGRFIHEVLPPYMGICTDQIGSRVNSAANREEGSGFLPNYQIVNVREAKNGHGLFVADADSARNNITAQIIAQAIAGQDANPTQILVFPAGANDASGVVLDVGVGSVCFGPKGWFFTRHDGTLDIDTLEGADVAALGMRFLMYGCGLPVDLLNAMRKQLNLFSKDKRESTQQAQKMIDGAICGLVGVVKRNPAEFGTPSGYSPASPEWAVKFNKKPDSNLVGVTRELLTQLGINLGDMRLLDSDVQIGEDADRKPIVGFSDGARFLIIGSREDGKKLKVYGEIFATKKDGLYAIPELDTPKKIKAALEWATACQEFVTPTK